MIMDPDELRRLVDQVRQRKMEPDAVEVKAAHAGTPKVYDSLSAFGNRPGGGILLLGLDETQGFKIVGVGDSQRVQSDIANWARDEMEPPLHLQFTADEFEGLTVLAVEVAEVPNEQKPCYYKPKGLKGNGGAYLRSGGTDRPMTDYEIFTYISSRGQPRNDEEIVKEATRNDLDRTRVNDYVQKMRRSRSRSRILEGSRDDVLTRLHICGKDGDLLRPTVAGLLMFGKYPQEFFPQFRITFLQYFGTTETEPSPRGERFLDNQEFDGSVPEMIAHAENHVLGAMRKSSLIEGLFRRDILEYPQEAFREALANAVAHRDYSPFVRGSYIQIRMFADRLEIESPGGLFGNVTVDNIEHQHSTRNARLMRMMEDLQLVENRGTGIRVMLQALREASLQPPKFVDTRNSFRVRFFNHTLMDPDAIRWLQQFAGKPLSDRQRLGLVYLRQQPNGEMANADYRRLNHVDPLVAGQDLRGLVEAGLIEQQGVGRWTSYRLRVPRELPEILAPRTDEDKILALVRKEGSITNSQCRQLLGVEEPRAYYLLKKLCDARRLKPLGIGKARRYALNRRG
jgi:ATP-dependent DNA helicase RecG